MPLGPLQHFTIEPPDLERTKDFYVDVLGLGSATARRSIFPAIGFIPAAWRPYT